MMRADRVELVDGQPCGCDREPETRRAGGGVVECWCPQCDHHWRVRPMLAERPAAAVAVIQNPGPAALRLRGLGGFDVTILVGESARLPLSAGLPIVVEAADTPGAC